MDKKNKIEIEGLDDDIVSTDTTSVLKQIIVNENSEEQSEGVEDLLNEKNGENNQPEEITREVSDHLNQLDDEGQKSLKERLSKIKVQLSGKKIHELEEKFVHQKAFQSEANRISSLFKNLGITIIDYLEDMIGLFVEHNYQSELINSNSTGHQIGYFLISHILIIIPAVVICLGVQTRNKIDFLKIPVMADAFKVSGMLCLLLLVSKLVMAMLLKIYENIMNHHNYGFLRIIKMMNIQEMILLPFLLAGAVFYGLSAYYHIFLYVGLGLMTLGVIVSYQVMSKMMIRFRVMVEEKLSYNILLPILVAIYYAGCSLAVYKMFPSFLELVVKGLLK